jgi:CRP-like cAMP-binding protein
VLHEPANDFSKLWTTLAASRSGQQYAAGMPLFRSGEPCLGIYLVQDGEVQLSIPGHKKKDRPIETARPGSMLGVCEAISGSVYKLSAATLTTATVIFVEREQLLITFRQDPESAMQVVRWLGQKLDVLYRECQASSGRRLNPKSPSRRLDRPSHPRPN